MSRNLINLLPHERTRRFRRDYFLHLATVALLLLSLLVIIHSIFLLPSYLSVKAEQATEETELASAASGTTTASAVGQLSTLTANATYLSRLANLPTASTVLRDVLAVPRPGVTLASFSETMPTTASGTGSLVISGVADSREDLRAYNDALSALPFISNVDLPISDYAADSNISFSMTLTGTLKP